MIKHKVQWCDRQVIDIDEVVSMKRPGNFQFAMSVKKEVNFDDVGRLGNAIHDLEEVGTSVPWTFEIEARGVIVYESILDLFLRPTWSKNCYIQVLIRVKGCIRT